jgi:methyltransferase (TIGR00027 family)
MEQWRLPGAPRENPTIGPRTRFYDDLVIDAIANCLGQVVLIAAGMDTRAFRLALPAEVIVFEVDLPELLAQKQAVLEQEHAAPSCRRVAVAADLARDDWPQALAAGGFDHAARTVFIVEGLSWYLTEEENARLLDDLANLAAPGSRLGIDIISRDHLESPDAAPLFKFTAALGILWQFGTDDPARFLAAHGWQAEVTHLDTFARRLGRRCREVPEAAAHTTDGSGRSYVAQRQTRSASVLLH